MPIVAVLPVKSFRLGKGRMAAELSPDTRSHLSRRFAERTAQLAAEAGMVPVLVAGDAEVAGWALELGFPSIPDPDNTLNGAAAAGAQWATVASSSWIVLHSDLPLLTQPELDEVVAVVSDGGWVIAPSADGGTSAFGGRGEARFAYGRGSFRLHLGRHPQCQVVTSQGLLHDIDSFADLESARLHPRGAWLSEAG